mgnify:CR=1 FL=1
MEFTLGLIVIASITCVTAMLPGPDMALVLKNSLLHSKREGVLTALGIVSGNIVYVSLTLAGLGVVITQSVMLFSIIKFLGAAYLIYLGLKLLISKSGTQNQEKKLAPRSHSTPYKEGLLTNLGNPKFLLFLFGIFTQVIDPGTTFIQQLMFGLTIPVAAFLSFLTITQIAGAHTTKQIFSSWLGHIEKAIGAALVVLGAKVVLDTGK